MDMKVTNPLMVTEAEAVNVFTMMEKQISEKGFVTVKDMYDMVLMLDDYRTDRDFEYGWKNLDLVHIEYNDYFGSYEICMTTPVLLSNQIEVSFENKKPCAVVVTFSYDSSVSVLLFKNWDEAMAFIKKDIMKEYYIDVEENGFDSAYEIFEKDGRAVLITPYDSGSAVTEWRIANVYDPNNRD